MESLAESAGSSTTARPRPLELGPIDLDAAPFPTCALEWSADGDLAAATADSVHILSPQFLTAGGKRMPIFDGPAFNAADFQGEASEGQGGSSQFSTETASRKQFGGVARIPIGYPRLDHRINAPLYNEWANNNVDNGEGVWQGEDARIGAGTGPLTGSGSTMNSVVSIAWSPSGVGRNRRCVLGVLTASGMLIIYGEPLDGGETDKSSDGQRVSGGRNGYDVSRWEVLWAVGERLAVPPRNKTGECIRAFAWTNACDEIIDDRIPRPDRAKRSNTKAFLVYQTDKRHLVVLSVGHAYHRNGTEAWSVTEIARVKSAVGAHEMRSKNDVRLDPFYVPSATSSGLRCSPWMVEKVPMGRKKKPETILTCIVGFVVGHYVGFRRLTVMMRPNVYDEKETYFFDEEDTAGFCIPTSSNSILRFEDGLWRQPDDMQHGIPKKTCLCRVVIATPMNIKDFEFTFKTYDPNLPLDSSAPSEHACFAQECSADSKEMESWSGNPISGLVVHPADSRNFNEKPLYTFVRGRVGNSQSGWYTTNLHLDAHERPDWADALEDRTSVFEAEGDDGIPLYYRTSRPDPRNKTRKCIWGLAQAPGGLPGAGGITAVLVSEHSAADTRRAKGVCRILFGVQKKRPIPSVIFAPKEYETAPTTTEAAMWTYMYGGGPAVVSKTAASATALEGSAQPSLDTQICSICEKRIVHRQGSSECLNGHTFDRCMGTGLAIQEPGVSRVCGVCGRKTLHPSAVENMLKLSGSADTDWKQLYEKLRDRVCGYCGGKFFGR